MAQDADLRDSVRYSLSGEHAHLFDLNSSSGQLSLKSGGNESMVMPTNSNNCLLLVHASDSLGPKAHNQTARINLLLAPQLMGRSLASLNQLAGSRSLDSIQSRSEPNSPVEWAGQQPAQSRSASVVAGTTNANQQQRSSLATVMSSLQHMIRSASLSEMPLPSALLLSALLALLICLLLVVVVAMSVHFYRRQTKSRHHRHQLIAASLAQAASSHFRTGFVGGGGAGPTAGQPAAAVNRLLMAAPGTGQHSTSMGGHASSQGSSAPGSLLSGAGGVLLSGRVAPASPQFVAKIETSNGISFDQRLMSPSSSASAIQQLYTQDRYNSKQININSRTNQASKWPELLTSSSKALGSKSKQKQDSSSKTSNSNSNSVLTTTSGQESQSTSTSYVSNNKLLAIKQQKAANHQRNLSSLSSSHQLYSTKPNNKTTNNITSCSDNSLISSSVCSSSSATCARSSNSKDCAGSPATSYDDEPEADQRRASSQEPSPLRQMRAINKQISNNSRSLTNANEFDYHYERNRSPTLPNDCDDEDDDDDGSSIQNKCGHYSLNRTGGTYDKRPAAGQESARLQSLAPNELNNHKQPQPQATGQLRIKTRDSPDAGGKQKQQLSMLSPTPKLDIKSYRKLELHNSPNQQQVINGSHNNEAGSLMGLIKEQRKQNTSSIVSSIRWPQEAIPQRVKQLTWDDELSLSHENPDEQTLEESGRGNIELGAESLAIEYGTQNLPPPMSDIASYGPLICNKNLNTTGDQIMSTKYSNPLINDKDISLASNSCSFLFSAPNSPTNLNEWLATSVSQNHQPPPQTQLSHLTSSSDLNNNNQNMKDSYCLKGELIPGEIEAPESICCDGQDNCFDYTIVQSSQFHVDSFVNKLQQHNEKCLNQLDYQTSTNNNNKNITNLQHPLKLNHNHNIQCQ